MRVAGHDASFVRAICPAFSVVWRVAICVACVLFSDGLYTQFAQCSLQSLISACNWLVGQAAAAPVDVASACIVGFVAPLSHRPHRVCTSKSSLECKMNNVLSCKFSSCFHMMRLLRSGRYYYTHALCCSLNAECNADTSTGDQ